MTVGIKLLKVIAAINYLWWLSLPEAYKQIGVYGVNIPPYDPTIRYAPDGLLCTPPNLKNSEHSAGVWHILEAIDG